MRLASKVIYLPKRATDSDLILATILSQRLALS